MRGYASTNYNSTPSIEDVFMDVILIGKFLESRNELFDVIIGVSRGGLIPAVILSHMLDISLTPITYSAEDGNGDDKKQTDLKKLPTFEEGTRILIIDDICDSGLTMKKLVKHYRSQGNHVKSAVLYYKDRWETIKETNPKHGFYPDFMCHRIPENSGWIIFPWEDTKRFIKDIFGVRQKLEDEVAPGLSTQVHGTSYGNTETNFITD